MKIVIGSQALRLAASKSFDPTPVLGWGALGVAVLAVAAWGWLVIGNEKAEAIWFFIVMALAVAAIMWRHEISPLLGI
ncbi:hypothetical protein [Geminicoccus flavidas]|uniref:hypothetical protein n=1 Tax=Geminicoccus flavidas TaxID=2506407 RepID=UPI001358BF61|nr:hypothetical protein [Geminicoccus flavidas]